MSALSDYSSEEQSVLNKLGYFWREKDNEWMNDKHWPNSFIYIDTYQSSPQSPQYCYRFEVYDSEGYRESDDYTYFDSFKELMSYMGVEK